MPPVASLPSQLTEARKTNSVMATVKAIKYAAVVATDKAIADQSPQWMRDITEKLSDQQVERASLTMSANGRAGAMVHTKGSKKAMYVPCTSIAISTGIFVPVDDTLPQKEQELVWGVQSYDFVPKADPRSNDVTCIQPK